MTTMAVIAAVIADSIRNPPLACHWQKAWIQEQVRDDNLMVRMTT